MHEKIINAVSGEIKEVSEQEFFALFDPKLEPIIRQCVAHYSAIAVAVYEDLELYSGKPKVRAALCIGPNNTVKEAKDLATAGPIGATPGTFRYPTHIWYV